MRFARYLLVQVLAYGVDLGGFIVLFKNFGVDPLIANMVSKALAGLFAFVVHRRFTFGVTGRKMQQVVYYSILLALNIPLSTLIFTAILWWISTAVVAKVVADMICVFLTYWLSKCFIFLGTDAVKSSVVKGRG